MEESAEKATEKPKSYYFTFCGTGGTLFGIQIVNLFLILVTFGIYYFWGKARVRKYIWSQIDICGDRLSYQGTGKETFFGWLKAMLIFGIPFLFFQNAPQLLGAPFPVTIICIIMSFILFLIFLPIAMIGMRKYRLSRTALRGIRFSFRGRWWEFARIFYGGLGLMAITLGFYRPYWDMRINAYIMQKTFFGSKRFDFDGKGSDLFGRYVLSFIPVVFAIVLTFLTIISHIATPLSRSTMLLIPLLMFIFVISFFIPQFIYGYFSKKYTWNHMTFDTVRFQTTITFGGYFWLYFSNLLLLMVTLGFGLPWVKVRTLRYVMDHLTLNGHLDMAAIVQDAQLSTATGEEIGGFLELDMDLA